MEKRRHLRQTERMARGPLIYRVGKSQVRAYTSSIIALSGPEEGVSESRFCIPLPALPRVLLSVDPGAVEVLMGLPEKIQTWSVPTRGLQSSCSN